MKAFLFAGLVAFLGVPLANATVEIRLVNGASDTGWLTCGDAGIVCQAGGTSVTFVGSVGNYSINTSTGISKDGVNPFLDLNSVDQAGANAGTLLIETMADGYQTHTTGWNFAVGGTNSLGGTLNFSAYGGNNDTICAHLSTTCDPASNGSTLLTTIGSGVNPSGSPFAYAGSSAIGNTVNPYSLGIVANIQGVSAGTVSFDAALDAVPEPASVALFGGILLFTVGTIRRKMRRAS